MSGLYDRVGAHLDDNDNQTFFEGLNKQLDVEENEGVTAIDLVALRGLHKQIMLALIRDADAAGAGIPYQRLTQVFSSVTNELPNTLAELANQGWIIILGEPPHQRYKVHMRRKRGSKLGFGIWSLLSQRLMADKE